MSKRKNGTFPGCIFVRHNKIYMKIGNQQRATGYNNTREGRNLAIELKDQWYRDEFLTEHKEDKEPSTIYEIFEEFLSELKRRERTNSTIRGYKLALKTFFPENSLLKKDIIIRGVQKFLDNCLIDKQSLKTITKNTYINKLQVFLNFCMDNDYLSERVSLKKYMKPVTIEPKKPYTIIELEQIINNIEKTDEEFSLLIKFMSLTGCRISESLKLEWKDIDFYSKCIKFNNKIHVDEFDKFPIYDELGLLLEQLKILSSKRNEQSKQKKVFYWEPSSTSRLARRLSNTETKLGIKKQGQGFHRIRNYFCNVMIDKGFSPSQVQDLMRHRDYRTTLKHYKQKDLKKLKSLMDDHKKTFNYISTH